MKFPSTHAFILTAAVILQGAPCFAVSADLEEALIKENFEQVRRLSEKELAENPDSQEADSLQYYVALSSLRLGDYNEAKARFDKLVEKSLAPSLRDKAYFGLYDSQYFLKDYKSALKTIRRLNKINPRSEFLSLIYLKTARAHLKLANWRKARGYLEKITRQFPESMEYHIARQLLEEKQYFSVQVGAFLEKERALKLVEKLKESDQYAYIVETIDQDGRKFYRVRVGQSANLDGAVRLKSKLSRLGYPTRIYP